MKSINSFVFLLLALIINVVDLTIAQFPATPVFRCRDTGNYTKKSAFDNNLMAALKKVGDMKKENGNFYSASSGKGSDTVNAVALCSDVGKTWHADCSKCVTSLNSLIRQKCPNQKEGVMWGSNCMLRYSDRKILGVLDNWTWVFLPESSKTSSVDVFDKNMENMILKMKKDMSRINSTKVKAVSGDINIPPTKIYAVMQCTPDCPRCDKCLMSIVMSQHGCCSGKTSAKMLSPSCYFSYSTEPLQNWKSLKSLSTSGYALQSKHNEKWTKVTVT